MIIASNSFYLFFLIGYAICQALYYTSFDPYNSLGYQELDPQLIDGGTGNHSILVIFLRPHFTIS